MVPSGGIVLYDRWIWLAAGFLVFVFFGFGKDALAMYRSGLLAIGLGMVFPSLRDDYRGSIAATIGSFNNKAKTLFKRKSFGTSSTSMSDSGTSRKISATDPNSPRKEVFLDAINETSSSDEKQSRTTTAVGGIEASVRNQPKTSVWGRMSSIFRSKTTQITSEVEPLPLGNLTGEQMTTRSVVTSGPRSPTLTQHARATSLNEVLIRKEVRQGSETAETLPAKVYGGA